MSREDLQKTIGMVAREARERMGLTQTEVAQRINVTPQQYGGIERGNLLPSTSTLRTIAETLGVSADVLLGLRGAPRRPEGRVSPARQELLAMVSDMPEEEVQRVVERLRLMLDAPGGQ
jgi:transcriptional regulator with XRE-family HTH domain